MYNIPLRVRNLIKRHDTSDPVSIAASLNIAIIYGNTPNRVNGFWKRILRRKYIGLDHRLSQAEDWQKKAVIAHEIAHILLHPSYKSYCMAGRSVYANSAKEDEADQFAAELLSYSCDIDKSYVIDFLQNSWKGDA